MTLVQKFGKPRSVPYRLLVSIDLEVAEKLIERYAKEWEGTNDFDGFLGTLEYCVKANKFIRKKESEF